MGFIQKVICFWLHCIGSAVSKQVQRREKKERPGKLNLKRNLSTHFCQASKPTSQQANKQAIKQASKKESACLSFCHSAHLFSTSIASKPWRHIDMNTSKPIFEFLKRLLLPMAHNSSWWLRRCRLFLHSPGHDNKLVNMSDCRPSERACHNSGEDQAKASNHAQHSTGLFSSTRSGGNSCTARFHHTRDFRFGRWNVILGLRSKCYHTDDNTLFMPCLIFTVSGYQRWTFCSDEIFLALWGNRDHISFNCSGRILLACCYV